VLKDREGGSYPNPDLLTFPSNLTWKTMTQNNSPLPTGSSDWEYYVGQKYRVNDAGIIAATPALQSSRNKGRAYFSSFTVTEYDPEGKKTRDIYKNINDLGTGWYFWNPSGKGDCRVKKESGNATGSAITISGTAADAVCSLNQFRFPIKTGYSYQISGYMKGEKITGNTSYFKLDFQESPSSKTTLPGSELLGKYD
jgi:endoglucanase